MNEWLHEWTTKRDERTKEWDENVMVRFDNVGQNIYSRQQVFTLFGSRSDDMTLLPFSKWSFSQFLYFLWYLWWWTRCGVCDMCVWKWCNISISVCETHTHTHIVTDSLSLMHTWSVRLWLWRYMRHQKTHVIRYSITWIGISNNDDDDDSNKLKTICLLCHFAGLRVYSYGKWIVAENKVWSRLSEMNIVQYYTY